MTIRSQADKAWRKKVEGTANVGQCVWNGVRAEIVVLDIGMVMAGECSWSSVGGQVGWRHEFPSHHPEVNEIICGSFPRGIHH